MSPTTLNGTKQALSILKFMRSVTLLGQRGATGVKGVWWGVFIELFKQVKSIKYNFVSFFLEERSVLLEKRMNMDNIIICRYAC